MKVCIEVTPIEKYLTGVGFYVLKLALTLQSLQISSSFQMGIAYQPRFFDWLRRRKYFPAPISQHLNKFSSCEYVDIPVRISNLFSKYSQNFLLKIPGKAVHLCESFGGTIHGALYL